MTSMPQPASAVNPPPASTSRVVIGGVDTHKELHVAAVIDTAETVLATHSFSTTRAGYRALIRWVRSERGLGHDPAAWVMTASSRAIRRWCRSASSIQPRASQLPALHPDRHRRGLSQLRRTSHR